MIQSPEFRHQVAMQLGQMAPRVSGLSAFVGLDGFVDEILHVVDKRWSVDQFDRVRTIAAYAERIAAASGQSTNIELVKVMTKLGGNGPIMGNALASFGLTVTYLGALGWPTIHPIFEAFERRATVASIGEPGHTDALEFEDGKVMVGKHYTLRDVNWDNIAKRYGKEKFEAQLASADLVGFVNWTMLPHMSEIWAAIQLEMLPRLGGPRRRLFVDLADPEKRVKDDIVKALKLVVDFGTKFDVILGLNEKEAYEVASVVGLDSAPRDWEGLAKLSIEIQKRVPVETLVVHPVSYALAVSAGEVSVVAGPTCAKPRITTGAGDHFNSGFCLGKLLNFDNAASLLCGVATSGHYVRTAESPTLEQISNLMLVWPED